MKTRCGECGKLFDSQELEEDYREFYKKKERKPIKEWYKCENCKSPKK